MKNTLKQVLPKLTLLLILLNFSNKSFSQSNCCNNDTIYFDNQVDCPICISIECGNPGPSPGPVNELIKYIQNNLPLSSLPSNCPNPQCGFPIGYISCGGPISPQLGKIVLKPNQCELCPNLKISLTRVGSVSLSPPISVYTSGGPTTATCYNCFCCSSSSTPNLEMSLDCTTKTLSLKCVQ